VICRASILHRKPRTRRERMLARFHAVRDDVGRRWQRLRHEQRRRTDHARAQKLFLQLGHKPHPRADLVVERARHARHARPHLRHPKP
jgi:hypothetical protein